MISDTIHAGGAETFVLRLARKLNQLGVPTDILCLNPDLEDAELIAQFSDVTLHRVSLPLLRWLKRADRVVKMLGIDFSIQYWLTGKVIERKGLLHYDVYHTHLMPVELLFSRLKQKYPEMKLVSTLHGDYNDYDHLWQIRNSKRKLNWPKKVELIKRSMNKWVYISKNQIALFQNSFRVKPEEMEKIYNGYEPPVAISPARPHSDNGGLQFIMVARMIKEKGWEYLIKAFKKVQGPHELVLVGKGPEIEEFKALAKNDPRIRFTGFHPNPAELIQEADVFAFPSIYKAESLPTVIIEALYCGKPVIATRIGDVEEMTTITETGEKAGLLLELEDDTHLVDDLIAAMNRYINDRSLLQHHGELAKAAFSKFDMQVCARRYMKVYEEACDKG